MELNKIYNLDNIEGMKQMIDEGVQVNSIVTDPPYNLSFMNKSWDSVGTPKEFQEWNYQWAEYAYQILKPGGYLVVFGGTRTCHRMVSGVEDAGFEIKDTLEWIYGSGFPKSYNISKGFDKQAGVERTEGAREWSGGKRTGGIVGNKDTNLGTQTKTLYDIPATDLAKQWNGYGTALKPAHEPILLAQKPREGTYCNNIEKYGCGGINIDDCRINTTYSNKGRNIRNEDEEEYTVQNCPPKRKGMKTRTEPNSKGRFPANLLLTHSPNCELIGTKKVKGSKGGIRKSGTEFFGEAAKNSNSIKLGHADKDGLEEVEQWDCVEDCPIRIMDEQSGDIKKHHGGKGKSQIGTFNIRDRQGEDRPSYGDKGGASRYFNNFSWQDEDFFLYTAKVSKSERTCEGQVENNHPTVKPIELIRWLIRLVTPKDGITVDLFCGSGTHPIAAHLEEIDFIAFEKEEDYWEIATNRYEYYKNKPIQKTLF